MSGRQVARRGKRGRRTGVPRPVVAQRDPVYKYRLTTHTGHLVNWNTTAPAGSLNLANGGLVTCATTAVQAQFYYGLAMGFCLSDLPDPTKFTALYDRYRITRVTFKLYPCTTLATGASTSDPNGSITAWLHSAPDYDDATAPTASDNGADTLRARVGYRCDVGVGTKPLVWSIVPRVAMAAYSGAFTSYANMASPWIDTASPNVQHYGMKMLFEVFNPFAGVNYINWKGEITYDLEFKNVI